MTPEEREELLAAYALGSLSAPDAAEVESMLALDPQAARDLAAYHEMVDLIALSVPMRRADPALRQRVLEAARIEARRRPRGFVRRPAILRYLPAAAVVGVIALLVSWATSMQATLADLRSETATLAAIVEADAKRLDELARAGMTMEETRALGLALKGQLEDSQVLAAIQADPKMLSITLQPTRSGHGAGGVYLWSDAAGAGVVVLHDLPQLPFGAVYRIWLEDRFSRLVAAADFERDRTGSAQAVLRVEGEEPPVRIYIVATSNPSLSTVDGPVILQGTVTRW